MTQRFWRMKMLNIEKEREAFLEWHFLEWKLNCAVTDTVEEARKLYERIYKPLHRDQISEREHGFKAWIAGKDHAAEKLEGCVVVPVEPTEDMLKATDTFNQGMGSADMGLCWAAMLEAARGGNE